jgi:small subunit ribosomal protein S16
MAVKIKLTRLGKIRNPQYRIAIADARNRRDGRSIEVIGRYHPKEEPSLIEIDSERAQYWLSVGAQPTEPVLKLLKITGDWQKFKGLPGTEGTLKVREPKPSKLDLFNAALAAADGAPTGEATALKKKKAPAKKADAAEKPEAAEAAEKPEAADAAEKPEAAEAAEKPEEAAAEPAAEAPAEAAAEPAAETAPEPEPAAEAAPEAEPAAETAESAQQ